MPAGALAGAIAPKMIDKGRSRVKRYTAATTTKKAPKHAAKIMEMIPDPSRFKDDRLSSEPIVKATNPRAISVKNDRR